MEIFRPSGFENSLNTNVRSGLPCGALIQPLTVACDPRRPSGLGVGPEIVAGSSRMPSRIAALRKSLMSTCTKTGKGSRGTYRLTTSRGGKPTGGALAGRYAVTVTKQKVRDRNATFQASRPDDVIDLVPKAYSRAESSGINFSVRKGRNVGPEFRFELDSAAPPPRKERSGCGKTAVPSFPPLLPDHLELPAAAVRGRQVAVFMRGMVVDPHCRQGHAGLFQGGQHVGQGLPGRR